MAIARITQIVVRFRQTFLFTALLASGAVASAQMWGGDYDPSWTSHISAGAMASFNIKADFKLGAATYPIASKPGVYDNGYVQPSQNANGLTSNWGYETSGQIVGQNLTLTRTTAFESPGAMDNVDMRPQVGFQATYGANFWYVGRARIGWEFGFGWLPIDVSANQSTSAQVDQSSDVFSLGNITVPPPGYHGTASGFGPSISTNSTPGSSVTNANGTFTGSQKLDANLFTFRLGPSVYMDFNRHVGMSLSAGPALGYVPGHLKYSQSVTANGITSTSSGSISVSDVTYGWYVNGMLTGHLVRNGDVFIGAEYMPLGTATLGGGGREASLNLKGQIYITAGINWPF